MKQTEPRRLQCLETVSMGRGVGGGGGGAVLGAFSASSVLKEMSLRESMSRLLLKTRDLINKIFYPDCVDFLKNNTVWNI